MNEKRFWEVIEACNWEETCDYKNISKNLVSNSILKEEEKEDFLKILDSKYDNIYAYVDSLEKKTYSKWISESDDGLSDLLAHVIGLGKDTYHKCLNSYEELSKYSYWGKNSGMKEKRVENFFYSFHELRGW